MSKEIYQILETKERLEKVSCSFCLAKWLQVTIHLQNGMTHSCHHPNTHKVPMDELLLDPSALHNTQIKKGFRKMMLEGQRPSECQYCWNIEDTPENNISDRIIKSNDNWAAPHLEKIAQMPWDQNIDPTYLEVSFSSVCNFKCAYCAPHISTKWMEEIKQHGAYPTTPAFNDLKVLEKEGKLPINKEDMNPYAAAFWKWWPSLYKQLLVFRITGGEPLLAKDTFDILNFINKNPNPKLELAINSNLGVPFKIIEKFADLVEPIMNENKVETFTVFTSVDTFGAQAEYIRYGLKFDYFVQNIEYFLNRLKNLKIVIMCTFNALSVVNFDRLLHEVVRIRRKYIGVERTCGAPLVLDISYLRDPDFLSVKTLSDDFLPIQERNLRIMSSLSEEELHEPHVGFYPYEVAKMKRLTDWMRVPSPQEGRQFSQVNFHRYFSEYDKRRNTDFLATFPDPAMVKFWQLCEAENLKAESNGTVEKSQTL